MIMDNDIRSKYEEFGVDNYYKKYADEYKNPHLDVIKELLNSIEIKDSVLDLCCGSGEVTNIINLNEVTGCDPYMNEVYHRNTGREAFNFNFKEISEGALYGNYFNTIICSFALHLCELSLLDKLLYQLSIICDELIIISPHKRPVIKNNFFQLKSELKLNRVYLKIYSSKIKL